MSFNPTSGAFEWTPDAEVVNNASADSSSSCTPGLWTVPSQQIIVGTPLASATGTLGFTLAPNVPRTWEEEEVVDKARAQAQWAQLMGNVG